MSFRGKTLHSKQRHLINNVTKFCQAEAKAGTLLIPLAQACMRAAAATGVSRSTVIRINREARSSNGKLTTPGIHRKRPESRNAVLDGFDICVLRNIIHEFYVDNKIPSINQLLPVVQERINFPWKRETLRKYIHTVGFQCVRVGRQRQLVERPQMVERRFRFLREMSRYRESQREIVYVGETLLGCNPSFFENYRTDERTGAFINDSVGYLLVVVHAGTKAGFVPNAGLVIQALDSSSQMNCDNFKKWVTERLLPNIPPNSVVCMDNATYHSEVVDPVPTKNSKKDEMRVWLEKREIKHDPNLRKWELFELIRANSPSEKKKYFVDQLLELHGHSVLRFPPYHCDLNAMELVWAFIRCFVKEQSRSAELTLERLHELVLEGLQSIGSEKWKLYCEQVEDIEAKYWETDGTIEEVAETSRNSDSETDYSSGSDYSDEITAL